MSTYLRTRLIFISIALVVLVGLLGYEIYAIRKEAHDSANLSVEVMSHATGDQFVKDLGVIRSTHAADVLVLDNTIVKKATLVPFLEAVEKTGTDLGLKTKIASVTGDQSPTATVGVRLTVETQGDWQKTMAFVHSLENLPYKIMIANVRITTNLGDADTKASSVWQGSVDITLPPFK